MEEERRKKRLLIGGVVAFVVIVVAISVANIVWNSIYSVTVNLSVVPFDAEVYLNGERASKGTLKLKPGDYSILVARDGFEPQTKDVTLEGKETRRVYFALVSNDPSTADWYETHPEDAKLLDSMSNWVYIDMVEDLAAQYGDVMEDLTVYAAGYTIGYGSCKDSGGPDFCVVIKADFGFRDAAMEYLQGTGKDLAGYYIMVDNYKTPFNDFEVTVPEGLEFSNNEMNFSMEREDFSAIAAAAEARISKLRDNSYSASVLQIKGFSDRYGAVKVKVSDGELGKLQDTYRMILAKIDGEWQVVSNIDFLLNYDANPKLPRELIRLANEF